jgi:hypothetical protein
LGVQEVLFGVNNEQDDLRSLLGKAVGYSWNSIDSAKRFNLNYVPVERASTGKGSFECGTIVR